MEGEKMDFGRITGNMASRNAGRQLTEEEARGEREGAANEMGGSRQAQKNLGRVERKMVKPARKSRR
jgi:hypothetical protein